MINRKFLLACCILALAGKQTLVLGMDEAHTHEQRAISIRNLRDRINAKREFISRACWIASGMWAITAGLATGWFYYKHNTKLSPSFRLGDSLPEATIVGLSAMTVNLGASWLTKHWGMYYFFTHRGQINQDKGYLKFLYRNEAAYRAQAEDCTRDLRTITGLQQNNRDLQQNIQNINERHRQELLQVTTAEQQARDVSQGRLQQTLLAINILRNAPPPRQGVLEPDPALLALSKADLEQQLRNEIQAAADENDYAAHRIRIEQLVIALANALQQAEEPSAACQQALLPVLKRALEKRAAELCRNLARCGLKLHMLRQGPAPTADGAYFQSLRANNELIRPFADSSCPVCFEDYDAQCACQILRCGHIICHGCAKQIAQSIGNHLCPICRGPM